MAYKLKIGNDIEIPIHLKLRNGGRLDEFKFHVTGKRLSADEAREKLTGEGASAELTINDFLLDHLTAWRGQTLVLNEDDQPADFSADALRAMLGVAGVAGHIYLIYLNELAAAGPEARRKN